MYRPLRTTSRSDRSLSRWLNRLEQLEDRTNPATVFVDANLILGAALDALPASVQVTDDRDNSSTLTAGDQVSIVVGGTTTANLTFDAATNTAAGDVASAYASLSAAITAAAAGDTIAIAPGTYAESSTINNPLTLDGLSNNSADVIIDPVAGVGISISSSGVVLQDLRVTGSTNGIVATNVDSLTLNNVQLDANSVSGLNLTGSGAAATLNLSGVTLTGNATSGGTIAGFGTVNAEVGGAIAATVTATDTSLQITRGTTVGQAVALTDVTSLNLSGSSAADTFVLTPSLIGGAQITVDGGQPSSTPGQGASGDRIELTSITGLTLNVTDGLGGFTGSITSGTTATIDFNNIESFVNGSTLDGRLFIDADGNGTLDNGEGGYAGATVFLDLDNDNQLDAGEFSTTTDASGNFSFAGLPPGDYSVRIVTPAGTTLTTSGTPAAVTISTIGDTAQAVNFGLQLTVGGTVTGIAYNDANNNGIRDTGEAVLNGITVFLDANANGVLDGSEVSATTDVTGAFSLSSIVNGAFVVRAVPSGTFTASTSTNVNLAAGNSLTTTVGLQAAATTTGGTVTGVVFADTVTSNGQQDSGEAGVRGVTVYLDLNNNSRLDGNEPVAVTDVNGAYSLTTTQNGTYSVRAVLSPGYLQNTTLPQVTLAGANTVSDTDIGLNTNLPPQSTPARRLAAGFIVGGQAHVKTFGPDGSELSDTVVFAGLNVRDVRVAVADVTGDGVEDIIVGTGPGVATQVVVLDGTTLQEIVRITPFESSFTGGVFVAAGDVTQDGIADIIITPDEGGGPRLVVYQGGAVGATGSFEQIASFLGIEDANFRGGARVAIADVNRDGIPDVIVAAGFGGGPRIAVFDGSSILSAAPTRLFNDFFVFESTLRNGAFIAAGDADGDGFADLIAGGGPGGGPRVLVLSGADLMNNQGITSRVIANFFAGNSDDRGGIRVTAKDTDGDGRVEIFTGSGSNNRGRGLQFLGNGGTPLNFDFDFGGNTGVFVG